MALTAVIINQFVIQIIIALFIDQPLIKLSHPLKNQSPVKWMKYIHSQLIVIYKAWYTCKEKEKATM